MKTNLSSPIAAAIMLAFADCNLTDEREGYAKRNLAFRAPGPLDPIEAADVMREAVPHGYNEFHADLLALLPADAQVTIAREGSVCIYVSGELSKALADTLKADEYDYDPTTGESRLWWD